MQFITTAKFDKLFTRLPKKLQDKAVKQSALFLRNSRHPSLNLEKLAPSIKGLWSMRVDKKFRIIVTFQNELAVFHAIGPHDWIYKFVGRL